LENSKHLSRQITDQKWGMPKNFDDVNSGSAGIEGLEASLTKALTTTKQGLSEVSSPQEKQNQ
jgi:hypothetical protein